MKIKLNTIQDVTDFMAISTKCVDVRASQGIYVVDAKSIMGLFALNHLIPFTLESDTYTDEQLKQLFYKFEHKEN